VSMSGVRHALCTAMSDGTFDTRGQRLSIPRVTSTIWQREHGPCKLSRHVDIHASRQEGGGVFGDPVGQRAVEAQTCKKQHPQQWPRWISSPPSRDHSDSILRKAAIELHSKRLRRLLPPVSIAFGVHHRRGRCSLPCGWTWVIFHSVFSRRSVTSNSERLWSVAPSVSLVVATSPFTAGVATVMLVTQSSR
jgi:hypothetical protein